MEAQISIGFNDRVIPYGKDVLCANILTDRGSKYSYVFAQVNGKEDIKRFLKSVRAIKPFDSADHCSYAFRVRSPEGVLIEGKGDDGETGAGQCILRELKKANAEQTILVISRHFGGIYLQMDRYKNIIDVSRMAIDKMK